MRPPTAQELREKITIINVTHPYDGKNEGTYVSDFAVVWAWIVPLGGDLTETTIEEQTATQQYNIWIRYIPGVTAWMQITWGTKTLVMTGPAEDWDNRHRWLLIHAAEKTSRIA